MTAQRSLHPYVSNHALSALAEHPDGGWVEFEGTLAFFDISGFTGLTERLARLGRTGAEHINDVLNTVFEGLIHEVFRVGGDVLEFGGDAMVVLFDGPDHEQRAAVATARMFGFMASGGVVDTPIGPARLRMSCGLASGRQAYHLTGDTRRALIVAGPVSTEMARLEAAANAGTAYVNAALAAALPPAWVASNDGTTRLRFDRIRRSSIEVPIGRPPADDDAIAALLPLQFRPLADASHRAGELKHVAMAFVRLDGTDDLLDAAGVEALHGRLREISRIVDRAAADLDVCWLETQAEANSARWTLIAGATTAGERDGERLLRVLRRIAELSPVPLRIGANRGVVLVGDMGHPDRCTFIAMGDATNLAARLMVKAHPGEILAGERLIETCSARFQTTALDPFRVKGKSAPVRAFVVGPVVESSSRAQDDSTVLVGRDRELEVLRRAIAAGTCIENVGDVGFGKTRLWTEVLKNGGGADGRWLVVRSEPHEADAPLVPFRRMLREQAGMTSRDDAAIARTAITTFVRDTAPSLLPWLPLIADVVGASVPSTPEVDALDPTFRGERLLAVLSELVAAAVGDGGVLVVEDAHWLDEASRTVVDALQAQPDRHCALVVTRRPGAGLLDGAETLELAPLDETAASRLLLTRLPAALASDANVEMLCRLAGGSPLFLLELARGLEAGGPDVAHAETVEQLLVARIDRLPVAGRELIRDLSVLGPPVSRALASRVLDRPELEQADVWTAALGDLVTTDGDVVDVTNELLRRVAYQGLAVRRRRAIHARAGDEIVAWGDSVPIDDPISALAFHASGSEIPDRIERWCGAASEQALERGAAATAMSLAEEVVAAQRRLGRSDADRREMLRRLATAAERAGHPERALEALVDASRLGDVEERAEIAVDRARLLEKLGRYRDALSLTARVLSTGPERNTAARLLLARAVIFNFRGRFRDALDICDSVIRDDAESALDRRVVAQAHLAAEWGCSALGRPERAAHEATAVALLDDLDDSIGLGNLYLNRGITAWQESRVADAIADFERSAERYRRAGDVVGAALSDNNVAEILTLQHRLDEAEPLLERARRVLRAARYPLGVAITTSGLARIAAWRGHHSEALGLQLEALESFRELGADDYVAETLVRLVELHVLVAEAAAERAASVAADAHAAIGHLGDVPVLPATLMRLEARVRRLGSDAAGRRELLEGAREIAARDASEYEGALAELELARDAGDDDRVSKALAQLSDLGVVAPPPGV